MPRKVFTAGEILTAANLNDVSDQSVMVFDDDAARTTAIPTPVEGMVTYRSDDDVVEVFNGASFVPVGPGQILQVVSTTKTDTFSMNSSTFADVTGLTATITPSSTSSKIMIIASVAGGLTGNDNVIFVKLVGGNLGYVGDASGSKKQTVYSIVNENNVARTDFNLIPFTMSVLDSPATTSSTTYAVQISTFNNTGFVNRSGLDTNNASFGRGASTITLMEVAG